MESDHIYGIFFLQLIVHKSQGMPLDLCITFAYLIPLSFFGFSFFISS